MQFPLYWLAPEKDSFFCIINRIENSTLYSDIVLPIFIAGGGQPSDKLSIILPDSTFIQIKEFSANSLTIPNSTTINFPTPFEINVLIDLSYRQAVMRAHTCQHLLSALILKHFSISTSKAVMDADKGQLFLEKPFPNKEIPFIVSQIWDFIVNPVEVTSHILKNQPLENGSFIDQNDNIIDLSNIRGKIPNDVDFIRIIAIGPDIDLNTCGGTHISSTKDILSFTITNNKKNELHFVCGLVSIDLHNNQNKLLIDLSQFIQQPFDKSIEQSLNRLQSLQQDNKIFYHFSGLLLQSLFTDILNEMQFAFASQTIPSAAILDSPDLLNKSKLLKFWFIHQEMIYFYMDYPLADKKILSEAIKVFFDLENPIILFFNDLSNNLLIFAPNKNSGISANDYALYIKKKFSLKGGGNQTMAQVVLKDDLMVLDIIKQYLKEL